MRKRGTVKVLLNINNADHKLKPGMYVSAVIRAALLANGQPAPTGAEGQWSCPMHPLVIQAQAGQCPVCQLALVQIPGTATSAKAEGEQLLLTVPVTAVLDSGVRKLVYVEKAQGQFAAVEIVTGPRTDDSYPVEHPRPLYLDAERPALPRDSSARLRLGGG